MSDVSLKDLLDCPELHSGFNCTIYDYKGLAAKVVPSKESSDPTLQRWLQQEQSVSEVLAIYLQFPSALHAVLFEPCRPSTPAKYAFTA